MYNNVFFCGCTFEHCKNEPKNCSEWKLKKKIQTNKREIKVIRIELWVWIFSEWYTVRSIRRKQKNKFSPCELYEKKVINRQLKFNIKNFYIFLIENKLPKTNWHTLIYIYYIYSTESEGMYVFLHSEFHLYACQEICLWKQSGALYLFTRNKLYGNPLICSIR